MHIFTNSLTAIGLALAALAANASPTLAESPPPSSIINADNDVVWGKKVAEGGYILHFRHAQREKWTDVTAFDAIELLKNYDPASVPFKRAVCLTEQGVQEAQLIGAVFEAADVKVGTVISSPSCRSRQTAEHAFGHIDMISNSLLHRTAIAARQHLAFNAELRKIILSSRPLPGNNTVLSGHSGTLRLDSGIVIDRNETGEGLDERDETGFVVLEVVGEQIIARYKFKSIMYFANAMIELPVTRPAEEMTNTVPNTRSQPGEPPAVPSEIE